MSNKVIWLFGAYEHNDPNDRKHTVKQAPLPMNIYLHDSGTKVHWQGNA